MPGLMQMDFFEWVKHSSQDSRYGNPEVAMGDGVGDYSSKNFQASIDDAGNESRFMFSALSPMWKVGNRAMALHDSKGAPLPVPVKYLHLQSSPMFGWYGQTYWNPDYSIDFEPKMGPAEPNPEIPLNLDFSTLDLYTYFRSFPGFMSPGGTDAIYDTDSSWVKAPWLAAHEHLIQGAPLKPFGAEFSRGDLEICGGKENTAWMSHGGYTVSDPTKDYLDDLIPAGSHQGFIKGGDKLGRGRYKDCKDFINGEETEFMGGYPQVQKDYTFWGKEDIKYKEGEKEEYEHPEIEEQGMLTTLGDAVRPIKGLPLRVQKIPLCISPESPLFSCICDSASQDGEAGACGVAGSVGGYFYTLATDPVLFTGTEAYPDGETFQWMGEQGILPLNATCPGESARYGVHGWECLESGTGNKPLDGYLNSCGITFGEGLYVKRADCSTGTSGDCFGIEVYSPERRGIQVSGTTCYTGCDGECIEGTVSRRVDDISFKNFLIEGVENAAATQFTLATAPIYPCICVPEDPEDCTSEDCHPDSGGAGCWASKKEIAELEWKRLYKVDSNFRGEITIDHEDLDGCDLIEGATVTFEHGIFQGESPDDLTLFNGTAGDFTPPCPEEEPEKVSETFEICDQDALPPDQEVVYVGFKLTITFDCPDESCLEEGECACSVTCCYDHAGNPTSPGCDVNQGGLRMVGNVQVSGPGATFVMDSLVITEEVEDGDNKEHTDGWNGSYLTLGGGEQDECSSSVLEGPITLTPLIEVGGINCDCDYTGILAQKIIFDDCFSIQSTGCQKPLGEEWDEDAAYDVGDLITWEGLCYQAIFESGPGNPDPPNDPAGAGYWTIVECPPEGCGNVIVGGTPPLSFEGNYLSGCCTAGYEEAVPEATWNKDTFYKAGDKVSRTVGGIKKCYIGLDILGFNPGKGQPPESHSNPAAPDFYYWGEISCDQASFSPYVFATNRLEGMKLGCGLYVTDYFASGTSTGSCCDVNSCTGSGYVEIGAYTRVSGVDCSGSGIEALSCGIAFNSGDFFVECDPGTCEATVFAQHQGINIVGTTGICPTGNWAGKFVPGAVEVVNVGELRFGDGFQISGFATGGSGRCGDSGTGYATIDILSSNPGISMIGSTGVCRREADGTGNSGILELPGITELRLGAGLQFYGAQGDGWSTGEQGNACDPSGAYATIEAIPAMPSLTVSGASCCCPTGTGENAEIDADDWDPLEPYRLAELIRYPEENGNMACWVREDTDVRAGYGGPGCPRPLRHTSSDGSPCKACPDPDNPYDLWCTPPPSSYPYEGAESIPTDDVDWYLGTYWTKTDCWAEESIILHNVADIRFGDGFKVTDWGTGVLSDPACPSGSGDYITITACSPSVSGRDCSGRIVSIPHPSVLEFDSGDFCLEYERDSGILQTGCPVDCAVRLYVKPKFLTVSGFSGGLEDCTGMVAPDIDQIRFGSGFNITEYVPSSGERRSGSCCGTSGGYIEIETCRPAFSISGFSGQSGNCCSEASEVYLESVFELRLGSGLNVVSGGPVTSGCCSDQYVTLDACVTKFSGVDCGGDTISPRIFDTVAFDSGSFCVTTGDDCSLLISGSGCPAITGIRADEGHFSITECTGMYITGCSGIQTIATESGIEICGCPGITGIRADSGHFSITECTEMYITGCSGIQTIATEAGIEICGCPGITGIRADEGYFSVAECTEMLITGCSGIQTIATEDGIQICFSGTGCGGLSGVNGEYFPDDCVELNITGSFCGGGDLVESSKEGSTLNVGFTITREDIENCLDTCCVSVSGDDGWKEIEVFVPSCVTDCYGCC